MQAAIDFLRTKGQAKADKKAGRTAAEGMVVISMSEDAKHAAIVEINCETDFVAREAQFIEFSQQVADAALANKTSDVDALKQVKLDGGKTVEERRKELVLKIGENIQIRRITCKDTDGAIGSYTHGGRIGVLVEMPTGDMEVAKDVAMHVAASSPMVVKPEDVAQDIIAKEKEIFRAQAAESGKPPEIVEKMVSGRVKKFLNEVALHGQPFVKDPNQTIEQMLKSKNAEVASFARFEVGEGIEKEVSNFAEEVQAQVRGE